MDLFGIKPAAPAESNEPSHEAPGEPSPEKPRPAGSHGLWLFLLVLDSVFVAVFGGAVALKVYQYWKAPSAAAAPAVRRHPAAQPPALPKPAEPAAAPKPPAPPPPPAPEPPKPEPKVSRAPAGPRPPKPSLLNEPPKPRSTPGLASGAASSPAPAPAAAAAPGKALPVVFKLTAPRAGSVQLVGAFIVHGGRREMAKASDGTWSLKLYLNPGQYRYFFSVDKKKTLDPENPNSDRGASLLTVP
ncbi:MAG TPA: hypothetical protein VN915_02035 [Elusimicrobiota bacterium]|nr:hypothetical protein [Elusimicrobiota bacterium]